MRIFYLFLFLIIFNQSFGQRWRPTQVVLANSDTVKGLGRLAGGREVFIKKAGDTKATKYNYQEAKSAMIDNEIFTSTFFSNLKDAKGKTIFDSAFVKVLVAGDLNLYYKETPDNRESPKSFILQKKDSSAFELVRKTIRTERNGVTVSLRMDAYKNQLSGMFRDCPSLNKQIKNDYFSEAEMTAVFENYARCKNIQTSYVQKFIKRKVEFTMMAGWEVTNVKFLPDDQNAFYYLTQASSQRPFIGGQLALPASRNGRFKLMGEVFYKSTELKMDTQSAYSSEVSQTQISMTYLKLNFGVKYSLPVKRVTLDFLTAFSNGFGLSKNYSRKISNGISSYQDNNFAFNNIEICYVYGIAMRIQERWGITVREETAISNFTKYMYVGSSSSHLYYGLTYKLGE